MATITKKELVERIAIKSGMKNLTAKQVIQMFLDEIIDELAKGNRLEFREFGVFETKKKKPRKARNPKTGEEVFVDAKTVVNFKVGRLMKDRVKNSHNHQDASAWHVPPPPPAPLSPSADMQGGGNPDTGNL